MSGPTIERGARTPRRAMRALQKASALGQADGLGISFNPDTGVYGLILSSTGGTDIGGGGLELKLADASLQSTSSGVSVHPGIARGLSTDGSGLGIKLNTNPGLAVSSGGLTLLEADSSLSLAAGGAAVALNTTGGLQTSSGVGLKLDGASLVTSSSGVKVQLDDTSGLTNLFAYDFSVQTAGLNVGALGGSGVIWYVTQNNFQPTIPDGSQVDGAMQTKNTSGVGITAVEHTTSNAAQAMVVQSMAIGTSYTVTAHMVPIEDHTGGATGVLGIFFRADKTGHSASQGIAVVLYTDKVFIQDNNGGSILGTTTFGSALSQTAFYKMILTVTGNSFAVDVRDGSNVSQGTVSGTSSNNATNTGIGFFVGQDGSLRGVQDFRVDANGTPLFSGLQIVSSGLGLQLDGTSLSLSSSGLKVTSPSPLTTKGDIYTFDTVNQRLSVGVNGQVLTADSTQTTGLGWQTPPKLLFVNTADSTAIANTVTPTVFSVSYTFPANFWTVGRAVRVRMMLIYSTTLTPVLTPLLRLGGQTVGGFGFTATSAGLSGARLLFDYTLVCRSTGGAGVISRLGNFNFEISSTGNNLSGPDGGTNLTVDTTTALALDSQMTWGTASASDTIRLYHLDVLQLS